MAELVAHPETGQPSYKEVNYVTVEFEALTRAVNEKEAELTQETTRTEELRAQLKEQEDKEAKVEADLGEAKSNVSRFNEISPQPQPDTGAEAASGENADQNAEGSEPQTVQF